MKKESNIQPEGLVRPEAPAAPSASGATLRKTARIFNEWAKRYSEKPEEFSDILDDNGKPVSDYGDRCAIYFNKLSAELDGS